MLASPVAVATAALPVLSAAMRSAYVLLRDTTSPRHANRMDVSGP
jgi:hypothetical protein